MFKFKMSLLFNNLKFRVAMVVLAITAILAGIIYIPKNRAGNVSEQVNVKASSTGIIIDGRDIYSLEKDGNVTGYDNIYCIEEEAKVGQYGYKTYSNPIDIMKAGKYFTNHNSAMWFINNMYISTIKGEGIEDEVAKEVAIINLANLLTTESIKSSVEQKVGVDYSEVTTQKIYNLRNKTIGTETKRNAIEIVEQIALWEYTKNVGTIVSSAYKNNPTQYLTNANLTQDEQKTLKYMYYALLEVTAKKSNEPLTKTTTNQVVLNKDNAKYDSTINRVGPYYLQSNGLILTSYKFGEVKNGAYPIEVTITKNDDSTIKAGSEVVVKNNDGSFYINLESYKDVKNVKFSISHIFSGVNTNAYVLEGGNEFDQNNQEILAIEKNVKSINLTDSKYSIELRKVTEDGTTVITSSEATFKINGKEQTTTKGVLNIVKDKTIKNEKQEDVYEIIETVAPDGYNKFDGTLNLTLGFMLKNNEYVIDENKIKADGFGENIKYTVSEDNTKITMYIPNTLKTFDLSLRKYISKINGKDVEPSREPIINEQSIKMLEKTGTASYYHTKNSICVTEGDEIEYTIRVYNEGEILSYAKQIIEYLPEGLSFVKISEDDLAEYKTKSAAGSKVVVLGYTGNTNIKTLRDFIGKEVNVTNEYYQEVKIICTVKNTGSTYLTNRSEITNYGYNMLNDAGEVVWKEAIAIGNVDEDSVQKTIRTELNLDTWYENAKENVYIDENGKEVVDTNYYPGVQDDDDFETVELLTGKYNIIIKKVDSKDSNKVLQGAYFTVKGSNIENAIEVGPTGTNGEVIVLKGVSIKNDKQVDEYTIKETKAPAEYKLFNGEINVKIATKFNGTNFVIDEKNSQVNGENIKFFINKENTSITIVVPNERKEFDLSLRKFITEVNGEELIESREPQVDVSKLINKESTTATYNHSKEPVDVNPTDIVTYTIRVYNEGELDGYASKIMDDVPQGLVFVPATFDENGNPTNINAKYRWALYREALEGEKVDELNSINYNNKVYIVTDNVEEADVIVTDYLCKENGENNIIKAFNPETMKELDYKEVKVAFKVIEPETSDRIIINYAQITENSDSQGDRTIIDRDSTPNEWIEGEDDQDIEKIKVRYFDLSLLKWVTKAIVYENGVETITETGHTGYEKPEPIVKVDLKNTSLNSVIVKFEYKIRITNEGEIAGYAKEISDYIPEGLKFDSKDNPEWKEVEGKIVTRQLENTLLQPGETADVTVVLTWINNENNLGLKVNTAEISEDYNDYGTSDIDSTPNNKVPGEDDIDDAPVILAIRTGKPIVYTGLAIGVLTIISLGAVVIRKTVLN